MMVRWSRFSLRVVLACALVNSHPTGAQVTSAWSVDATVGGARGNGGEFFDNDRAAAHVGVTGRILRRGMAAAHVELGYDWLGLEFGTKAVCVPSSRGGCKPPYPDLSGPSATIGMLVAPASRVEARLGLGGAMYSIDGTRVGAAVGQLDLTAFPTTRIGFVVGGRYALVPRYQHDRLWMMPVLIGLRVR